MHWLEVLAAGVVVGTLFGFFGVGGSSFATPLLSLAGLSGFAAVASPLPATIPAAVVGASQYAKRRDVDWRVARWTILGGFPATIAGALLSQYVGGPALLIASGITLGVVGVRVLRPIPPAAIAAGHRRSAQRGTVVLVAVAIGLFTGLLANGGGFLLVPAYLLLFGLSIRRAAGTSLVVIAALTVPTLLTHWALGHIDWSAAAVFALGSVPASWIGSRASQRFASEHLQRAFGILLITFAVWFVVYRLFLR